MSDGVRRPVADGSRTRAFVRRSCLDVLDLGDLEPVDSHAIWHAFAHRCERPTLLVARPRSAYVSLGYHRHREELDWGEIQARRVPVVRRRVGGGPVWLDQRQRFFQVILPRDHVVAAVRGPKFAAWILERVARSWRRLGLETVLDGHGEISCQGRKVCGHGSGEIAASLVVVGNLLEAFDPEAAAGILSLSRIAREEAVAAMRRHVGPSRALVVDPKDFVASLVQELAEILGDPRPGILELDQDLIARYRSLVDEDNDGWVRGAPNSARRSVKIRAGVWLHDLEHEGRRCVLLVEEGRLTRLRHEEGSAVTDPALLRRRIERDRSLAMLLASVGASLGDEDDRTYRRGGVDDVTRLPRL